MTRRLIEAAKFASTKLQRTGSASLLIAKAQLDAAISDAEQQAADDALPITREWFFAAFKESHIGIEGEFSVILANEGGVKVWVCEGGALSCEHTLDLQHIKTRGQLRRLIAALKGGE